MQVTITRPAYQHLMRNRDDDGFVTFYLNDRNDVSLRQGGSYKRKAIGHINQFKFKIINPPKID